MADYVIPVSWYDFVDYYPLFYLSKTKTAPPKIILKLKDPSASLAGELDDWVTGLINESPSYTTCCIQMSHAINMAFYRKDASKMVGLKTYRRKTRGFKIKSIGNQEFHYVPSVDEMKKFLEEKFGAGLEIKSKDDINGTPGIIVFMSGLPYGLHTEVWTGDNFHQAWMRGNFNSLKRPKVFFWGLGDPTRPDV